MSTESDGSNGPPLITHAPTLVVPIERIPFVAPDKAEYIDDPIGRAAVEKLWELSSWEKVTLFIDDGIEKTVFYAGLLPHIVSIIWSVKIMKNWKTTVTGLLGAVVYVVQALWGIVVPQEVVIGITALLGLFFAKDAGVTGTGQ